MLLKQENKMKKEGQSSKFSIKLKSAWQKFCSFFKREKFEGKKNLKCHSKFFALVAIQYRDKNDTSWTHSTKTIIQKLVFVILKFVLIFAVVAIMLRLVATIFMMRATVMKFYLIFLGLYTILNLLSVTFALVKSLYHAEDNKVLATYPTSSASLFLSKILVFELFELKKSFDILLPITLGFIFTGVYFKAMTIGMMFWAIIPLIIVVTITVLLGALLSIPALYIYNILKKHALIELLAIIVLAGAIVYGLVYVINLIPENKGDIDINRSYAVIKEAIDSFTVLFAKALYPVNYAYRAIVGESLNSSLSNVVTGLTVARVGIMLGVSVVLFVLVFFIIKPFYFVMMTKTFEFNKDIIDNAKHNKIREKHWTFVVKEIKLTLRDLDISASYLGVYIAVPILLLFIDKIFAAMSTSVRGDFMIAAFNILLIALPLLASSTMDATLFSREGRAAYIKKTKPLRPYFPLSSKLFFNLLFVIPSIAACSYIFVKFTNCSTTSGILLGVTILALQYGHIFYSATLDIMNPQNEIYATEGGSISNPNERKSTIIGFIVSFFFALVGFVLLRESFRKTGSFDGAFIKLLLIGLAFAGSCILLFFLKIKAYYIDRQEATRE